MKHAKTLVTSCALILVVVAASGATKTPDSQRAIAVQEFSHQVKVRWVPLVDAIGRQVVQLSIEYTRSADVLAYDRLFVVVSPSNRLLMRVVDPDSAAAQEAKALDAKAGPSSYVTSYAKLDHFTQTVILPYTPGADDRIIIALKSGDETRVLARTRTNLSNPVTFTTTIAGKRLASPAFQHGVIHSEATYCYESDWCQEVCITCNSEPTWDSGYCSVTCNDPPAGGDDPCYFNGPDNCVYSPNYGFP